MIKIAILLTFFASALIPIHQPKRILKPIEKDSILIGDWMVVGFGNVGDNGRVLWGQCNACSHINFDKDGQGVIKDADGYGSSTTFTWALKTSKLLFKFTQKKQRSGFIKGNLEYISSYSRGKDYEEIILLDAKRKFEFMLSRTAP